MLRRGAIRKHHRSMVVGRVSLRTMSVLAGAQVFLAPKLVHAMHLSEGILPVGWSVAWYAVAFLFVAIGLRELRIRFETCPWQKAMVSLVGAAVFIISCMPIPVPLAGTTSHPCGTGLAAVLIGPGPTAVVTSVALVLQALFLGHGGLSTLGANTVSMGVAGAYCGYGAFRLARAVGVPWWGAVFVAGVLSDWATYGATSLQLAAALHGARTLSSTFAALLVAFAPTQVPLGVLEGLISAGAYRFVQARRPDLLAMLLPRKPA